MTVLIAGAGIAGLSLALSCHATGIPFEVFEQVESIQPLGVGINLQPHAVRELIEMGLEHELGQTGIRTRELVYFSKHGKEIWREPRGLFAGYRWPQFSVHRGKLQLMLLDALLKRGAGGHLHTGAAITGFADGGDRIEIEIQSSGGSKTTTGAVLVACDGLHSRIRAQLNPTEGNPVWGGAIMWRGTTLAPPYLSGASIAYAGHERQKFVTYPIGPVDAASGRQLINWIAERKFEPNYAWRREDYNRRANLDDFLPQFADWRFDWLDIPAIIRGAEHCYEFPMVDRNPLERWTHGRVTLVGDAAHAMYPIGSNGASQAILDARVLTQCFRDHGLGIRALEAYEADRRPATTRVVLANRGNGPDQVMQVVEERCAGRFERIEEILSRTELEEIAGRYKQIAGMDVDTLNARPSLVRAA